MAKRTRRSAKKEAPPEPAPRPTVGARVLLKPRCFHGPGVRGTVAREDGPRFIVALDIGGRARLRRDQLTVVRERDVYEAFRQDVRRLGELADADAALTLIRDALGDVGWRNESSSSSPSKHMVQCSSIAIVGLVGALEPEHAIATLIHLATLLAEAWPRTRGKYSAKKNGYALAISKLLGAIVIVSIRWRGPRAKFTSLRKALSSETADALKHLVATLGRRRNRAPDAFTSLGWVRAAQRRFPKGLFEMYLRDDSFDWVR